MRVGGWLFAGVWITIWTVGTTFFDVALVRGVVHEVRCQDWPTTQGTVVSAEIKVEQDSESGNSYTPIIRYRYAVKGIEYQSERIRFGFTTASKGHARRTIEAHPPGRAVVVHYDPVTPGRAVLETGVLTGSDLFGVIFLVPFNLIMLGSWVLAWRYACGPRGDADQRAAGNAVVVLRDGDVLRVRLTRFTPLAAGAVAAVIAAAGLIFVIALTFGTDSRSASAGGCGVVAVAAIFGYRWMRARINDGWYDLILDDVRRKLTLPGKLKRADANETAFDDVTDVEVEKITGSGDESDKYRPTLRWTSRYPQSAVLIESTDGEAAERLAQWLREKLTAPRGDQHVTRDDRAAA